MGYSKRIKTLCSLLKSAETFADVGCDHGYCSEYVLKNGLCEKVILSDISQGSLRKAETLLAEFIDEGKAVAVLGDGFKGVPKNTQEVLIAGMGGSEIVSILSDERYGFLPEYFVFQPMHDSEKLRRYLIEQGAVIYRDYTFSDGKYYDVICGGNGKSRGQGCDEMSILNDEPYSDAAFEFGKENLTTMPTAFCERLEKQLKELENYLAREGLQEENRLALLDRQKRLKGVLCGEIK